MKTKKSVLKRFSRTSKGKILFRPSGSGHLLRNKSSRLRRANHKVKCVSSCDYSRVSVLLG